MKKKLVVAAVLVLGLAAFLFLSPTSPLKSSSMKSASMTGASPFTSIQDALSRSLSLECTFTDDSGRQTKTYVKAGAVRTSFTGKTTEESGNAIIKDKKMYFWNEGKKEGFMMEVPEVTPGQTSKTAQTPPNGAGMTTSAANVYSMLEKFKNSCKARAVADPLFTPPADVSFKDYSQMMKDLQNMMKPSAGAMNEENLKQMMERYGKSQ